MMADNRNVPFAAATFSSVGSFSTPCHSTCFLPEAVSGMGSEEGVMNSPTTGVGGLKPAEISW